MWPFNRKKTKEPEYLFTQTVTYKGYDIFVYCQKQEHSPRLYGENYALIGFKTGWQVNEYGQFNTGVCGQNLTENMQGHVESAKRYIDKVVALPDDIRKAKDALNNMKL